MTEHKECKQQREEQMDQSERWMRVEGGRSDGEEEEGGRKRRMREGEREEEEGNKGGGQ